MSARFVTLVAGVFFFFLALITQGFLPFFEPSARTTKVTAVVRTDLGQLKWMQTNGYRLHAARTARPRSVSARGLLVLPFAIRAPGDRRDAPLGPGDARRANIAYDMPHLFGTRRIGPDLMRVGLKYSDEWHFAHFWNPRMLSPGFDHGAVSEDCSRRRPRRSQIVDDGDGNRTLEKTPVTEKLFDFASKEQIKLTPNADGLLFVPMQARGKAPVILTPQERIHRQHGQDRRRDTKSCKALIAYVQKLGMNRGKWRDLFEPQELEVMDATLPRSEEWIAHGKEVYERRCLGCHGVNGDGNGPAATFLYKQRPRNFTARLQVQADQGTAADRRRSVAHDHAAGCAAPRCRPGMTCRSRIVSPSSSTSSMCWRWTAPIPAKPYAFFRRGAAGSAAVHRQAARLRRSSILDRGKEVWEQRNAGSATAKPERAMARRRPGLKDDQGFTMSPRRPHQRPVQIRSGGRRHLPHHHDRA